MRSFARGPLAFQQDFALDLDRDAEGELAHADRRAGMRPALGAEDLDDQIGAAVDHRGHPIESGRGVHHSEHAHPAIDAIEARVTALQKGLAGVTGKPAGKDASPVARSAPKTTAASAKVPAVPAKAPDAKVKAEQAVAGEEWVVNIASSSHEQAMLDMAAKLREQGIPVERQALTIEGDLMYRLRVPGFATSAEARSYAGKLDKEFGLRGGWVSRK